MEMARVEVKRHAESEQEIAVGAFTVKVLPGVSEAVVKAANWWGPISCHVVAMDGEVTKAGSWRALVVASLVMRITGTPAIKVRGT